MDASLVERKQYRALAGAEAGSSILFPLAIPLEHTADHSMRIDASYTLDQTLRGLKTKTSTVSRVSLVSTMACRRTVPGTGLVPDVLSRLS